MTMEVSRAVSLIYLFIRQILLQAALLASIAQKGGEGTQAEVIMVLSGELLHSQGVKCVHLLGQNLRNENRGGNNLSLHKPLCFFRKSYRDTRLSPRT